ncbi:MAG: outer membrane beta-barrel family protein [Paludibacter sp.]|nr:outer membrane beta-barrel family protein [Paludibacter sp.]
MKNIFISLLFIVFSFPLFALYTIKGKIVDATTQSPLDFVNVALYKQNEEAPATGVVSDVKGDFQLPNVPKGKYFLRVSFVGYNTINIPLNVSEKELNMGMIKLFEDNKTLTEVQVIGQGTQMRFEIDKKVFSVDQNIAAAGGSASEVLQNIPAVEVDGEGNVSLRNSSSVEVWINGKPSGLTAENRAQILQQMPAESIQEIEIMTNPSAKFNPEGTSGIINLVLKKNRKGGYYGSVSAGTIYAQGGKPGATLGANVNYSSGKIDAYLNVGYRAMNFQGGGYFDRYNLKTTGSLVDTLSLLSQQNVMKRGFSGLFTRAGIDYRLNDKNTLSLTGFGMAGSGYSVTNIDYSVKNYLTNATRKYARQNTGAGTRPSLNLSLDHKYEIDKNGSNLMTSLSYSTHKRASEETYVQTENQIKTSDITQIYSGNNNELQFKIDYTKKFDQNTRLETGWQSTAQNRASPANGIDNTKTPPADIKSYFNEFLYNEQIHAAYVTYGSRIDKLSIQGGLRAEYMLKDWENKYYTNANVIKSDKSNYKPVVQLFPSAYLSYTLPKNNELQLNFTRRINRARGREINPFRNYSDSTNISFGNPDLLPELTSAFEFNYLKTWDNHSLSASAYYRFTDDVMQSVRFMNKGVMENTTMNVTNSNNTGVELVAKNRFFKLINLTSSVNLYYNRMEAATYTSLYDNTLITNIPEQQMFSWSGRIMANIILGKNTFAQISGDYSAPRLVAQGKESSSYAIDLGLRQTFLNQNLSLNFMVRDLLDSRRRSLITWGDGFYQKSQSYFHGRMIGLTATYNFGNMKPKKTQRKQENNQDMNFEGGISE